MSKKSRAKQSTSSATKKLNRINTLQNKITRLETKVQKNPADIAADMGLSQARYDLNKMFS